MTFGIMKKNTAPKSNRKIKDTKPEYFIKKKPGRFLDITIKGDLTKPLFFKAMHELINHPDYFEKSTIWNLLDAKMRLSFEDLREITYILRKYKLQQKVNEKKLAVVASGEFNIYIIKFSIELLSFLPFEFRIFDDYDEAIIFLKNSI